MLTAPENPEINSALAVPWHGFWRYDGRGTTTTPNNLVNGSRTWSPPFETGAIYAMSTACFRGRQPLLRPYNWW